MGRRKDVYVLAKILKWITGSSVKSYSLKFALDFMLGSNTNISENELGLALQEVINYKTFQGKFDSVHLDLRAEGVTGIEVGDQGITFHRDQLSGKGGPQNAFSEKVGHLAQQGAGGSDRSPSFC